MYFPQLGWIEFEPTAGDPALARPGAGAGDEEAPVADMAPTADPAQDLAPAEDRAAGGQSGAPADLESAAALVLGPAARALVGLAAILAVVVAGSFVWWRRPLGGLSAAQGAFARLTRVAAWLGLAPRASDTSHEYAARLGEAIPEGRGEITSIVDAFVRERFGRRSSDRDADALRDTWRKLRSRLVRAAARLGARRLRRRP